MQTRPLDVPRRRRSGHRRIRRRRRRRGDRQARRGHVTTSARGRSSHGRSSASRLRGITIAPRESLVQAVRRLVRRSRGYGRGQQPAVHDSPPSQRLRIDVDDGGDARLRIAGARPEPRRRRRAPAARRSWRAAARGGGRAGVGAAPGRAGRRQPTSPRAARAAAARAPPARARRRRSRRGGGTAGSRARAAARAPRRGSRRRRGAPRSAIGVASGWKVCTITLPGRVAAAAARRAG